jgi:histone arginine demethylase JMJD6
MMRNRKAAGATKENDKQQKPKIETSQNENKNDNDIESKSLSECLNEAMELLKAVAANENDASQPAAAQLDRILNLKSYKQFSKLAVERRRKQEKLSFPSSLSSSSSSSSSSSLLPKLTKHCDILLLVFLNFVFLLALCYFLIMYYSPDSSVGIQLNIKTRHVYAYLIKRWMLFNGFTDLTKEECALVLPDFFNSIIRPIDDCSMCTGLDEIKRVQNISKQEFLEKYAYTGRPVIVTDATLNWTAMSVVDFEFLRSLYLSSDEETRKRRETRAEQLQSQQLTDNEESKEEKKSPIMNAFDSIVNNNNEADQENDQESGKDSCQFFPYKTKFKSLRDVFEMEVNDERWTKPWYIGWSNCNNYASQMLRKHYARPYFLPDDAEMSKIDWIFMGTPNYGAYIHIDDVNNPSWQVSSSSSGFASCLFDQL